MRRSLGFTLAEVLITLTIIGVIAAITIPTLMKNYEKRQIEVGLVKTYQELSNVMKRSEIDNGLLEEWTFEGSRSFANVNKYFAPYMQLKQCTDNCFSGKRTQNGTFYTQYLLPDGTFFSNIYPSYLLPDGRTIQFYDFQTLVTTKWISIVVDVNGKRGKSVLGQDVFMFTIISDPIRPQKGVFTGATTGGHSNISRSKENLYSLCSQYSNPNGIWNCGIILQKNGWKFPDDYPIKF